MFSTLGIFRVHSYPVCQRLQGRAVHTVSGAIRVSAWIRIAFEDLIALF